MADGLMLGCLMIVFYFSFYSPLSSDSLLGWPITDSIMHPERYSPDDLLVKAGITGPFLLYRLLAFLPFQQDNFPLRDFLIYIPLLFLYLVAWWKVFSELGASRPVATTSILFILFSDNKLGLNWSLAPMAYLTSSSSVLFIQVFGLYLFFTQRRALALGLTAATGIFHPATSLSFGAVYTVIIIMEALRKQNLKELTPVLIFFLVYLPIAVVIALNNQDAFSVTEEYFRIFERYQPQAYLGDHFRMGYAYTLCAIAFLYRYFPRDVSGLRHRNDLFLFIGIGLVLSLLWLINLYFIKNLQGIHTFFIMRIFYLIKPLLIFLIVTAAVSLYNSPKSVFSRMLALLFLMTPALFSPSVALIIVITCAAYAAGKRWWPILFGCLIIVFIMLVISHYHTSIGGAGFYFKQYTGGNELNMFQGILLVASGIFIFMTTLPGARQAVLPGMFRPGIAICLAVYLALFPMRYALRKELSSESIFNFQPADYWGIRSSDRTYSQLLDWAKFSPEKLFAVPPYNDRFLSFRYLSGKGVFVFHRDIAQLMYTPKYYGVAVDRLLLVGGHASDLPKAFMSGEVPRGNGIYETQCQKLIENGQFDAIIFEKKRLMPSDCLNGKPIFENGAYVVYRTAFNIARPN